MRFVKKASRRKGLGGTFERLTRCRGCRCIEERCGWWKDVSASVSRNTNERLRSTSVGDRFHVRILVSQVVCPPIQCLREENKISAKLQQCAVRVAEERTRPVHTSCGHCPQILCPRAVKSRPTQVTFSAPNAVNSNPCPVKTDDW